MERDGMGPAWVANLVLVVAVVLLAITCWRQWQVHRLLPLEDGIVLCPPAGRCVFQPLGTRPLQPVDTVQTRVFVPQAWYTERLNEVDTMIRKGCRP